MWINNNKLVNKMFIKKDKLGVINSVTQYSGNYPHAIVNCFTKYCLLKQYNVLYTYTHI